MRSLLLVYLVVVESVGVRVIFSIPWTGWSPSRKECQASHGGVDEHPCTTPSQIEDLNMLKDELLQCARMWTSAR